jgi:AsmA family protein
MIKRRRWILLPVAALAAILLVVLVLFDWNWLKGPIESAASAALGRGVEIAGELDVDLSTTPTIALERLRIANAEWGSRPHMLTIPRVDLAVKLWPLLRGRIELPFLRVQKPDLLLETNRDGDGNWQFGAADEPAGPPAIPLIGDLQIAGAAIRFHEPGRPQDLVAALDTVAGAVTSSAIRLRADGALNQEPLSLRLASASAERLDPATAAERFPFELDARLGSTQVAATGSAERLLEVQGLSVEVHVQSDEPGTLLVLAGREPRDLGALEVRMAITRQDEIWGVQDLAARLGESDIRGSATVELGRPEPLVTAELASDQVRFEDFGAIMPGPGAQAGGADPETAIDGAVADARSLDDDSQAEGPAIGLDSEMLPRIDAELSYAIAHLTAPELALDDVDLYARLEEGLPRVELTGGGQYRDLPVALDVRLGSTDQSPKGDGAYPVWARIEAAGTEVHLDGEIGRPETMDGLDLQVQAASENITELLAVAAPDLPQIPPFAISGHVVQDGQVWRIADFYGQFSDSELAGNVTADLSKQRPFITAALESSRLLVSDLVTAGERPAVVHEEAVEDAAEATDTGSGDAAKEAEDDGDDAAGIAAAGDGGATSDADQMDESEVALISLEGANFEALPRIDADVAFQGQAVEHGEFRFDQLSFDLKLRDQVAVLDAAGEGQYRGGPLSLEAHLGNEETLENPDARFPIDVQIASEETRVTVEGTSTDPARLAGLDVDVVLAGPDLNRLGEILQLPLPATPPFKLRSHLTHEENRWNLAQLNGTVGDSDVQGDASLVLGGARPLLEAELTSNALDFDDLGLLVGAPADPDETVSEEQERAAAEAAARENLLPDEPFDVPELRVIDARVSFQAKQVRAQKVPLEGMALDLTLEDGRLTLEPLRFAVADGTFDAVVRMDARSDALAGELDLDIGNVRLNQLLARFDIEVAEIEMEQEGIGTFSGRGKLAVRGNSVSELAGSAEGQAAVIMRGGQLNALIMEAIGLDVGEAVALLLTGDEEAQSEMVPIRCLVGDFELRDGVMRAEALVLDTTDSTITGKGQIDLGAETLALEFVAHPKDASVLTASTPVRIEGTFKEPEVDVVSEELQEKSLAALALGVILPVLGAVFPFIEQGETEDKNCGRLIEAALASVERASPSPPPD